jgi:arylamine N-acetyltransferase
VPDPDRELVAAYLDRLGVEAEPPSVDALVRLHQSHAERIAYETFWIHLGERRTVDPMESLARLATSGRGGYCYHLNGAMSLVLGSLGYEVTRHVAGVYKGDEDRSVAMTNHLVLTVAGLATEANPGGRWYFDVGLGDALHSPLPLVAGEYVQPPFTLRLDPGTDGLGEWHFGHDPDQGAFTGSNWREGEVPMEVFVERNEWLSTDPESGFVRFACAERREADAVDLLKGCTLRRLGAGAFETTLTSRAELLETLVDRFHLDLSDADPAALDTLWQRMWKAHQAWEAAGRP